MKMSEVALVLLNLLLSGKLKPVGSLLYEVPETFDCNEQKVSKNGRYGLDLF